jgi:signal transduction histidine kinase
LLARVRLHSEAYIHELQRQRAYRALEASQRELTEKNCELELLNQKLEEATRFRSIFFANVSHEVRTQLIGVLGMAEILSDSRLPPVPHQHKGRPIKRLTKFWIFH